MFRRKFRQSQPSSITISPQISFSYKLVVLYVLSNMKRYKLVAHQKNFSGKLNKLGKRFLHMILVIELHFRPSAFLFSQRTNLFCAREIFHTSKLKIQSKFTIRIMKAADSCFRCRLSKKICRKVCFVINCLFFVFNNDKPCI